MSTPRANSKHVTVEAETDPQHVVVRWASPKTDEGVAALRKQIAAYQARLGEHANPKAVMIYTALIGFGQGLLARYKRDAEPDVKPSDLNPS